MKNKCFVILALAIFSCLCQLHAQNTETLLGDIGLALLDEAGKK